MTAWSLRKAMFFLVGSTLLTLSLFSTGFFFWQRAQKAKQQDSAFLIRAIIQTGPEKEALQTAYLAELLSLSADQPTHLYRFSPKEAEAKLLASPLIRAASVRRLPPQALYIDYEARKPIAWLGDYDNIAIDKDGYLFPVAPFMTPKELPQIYLGLPPFGAPQDREGRAGGQWHVPLQNRYLQLSLEVLSALEGSMWKEGLRVKRIDVSNAFAESLGSREIVLFTEEELIMGDGEMAIFPKILRLWPKDYGQQLANFFVLRKSMMEDYKRQIASGGSAGRFAPRIVDLRIPQLAFVENTR